MRIAVLADTHIRDRSARTLPARAWEEVAAADLVLHAGDVVEPAFLGALAAHGRVDAVLGNNDGALAGVLPEVVEVEVDGVRIAMIHDSGARQGREARLHRRFPHAALVVFGHSHIPWNQPGVDGQWLLNPGSPTERRGQPNRTMAVVTTAGGAFRSEIVVVG